MVILAVFGALLVAGLVTFDFLHLRQSSQAPAPATARTAPPSSPPAAVTAPSPGAPPTAAPSVPALLHPASPAGERSSPAPHPTPAASGADRATLLERAQAAFDQGQLDRAQANARRAAALGSPAADALLGAIAFKRGNFHEAERLLDKALQGDPGNARIARQLELVRAKQGP